MSSTTVDPLGYNHSRQYASRSMAGFNKEGRGCGEGDDDDDSAIEILHALLSLGCDVNAVEHNMNQRALHFACELSKPKLVSFLVANGADVNVATRYWGSCLLMVCAAKTVSLDVARILVEGGADINIINEDRIQPRQHSALFIACWEAPAEVVRFLLASGARVNMYYEFERHPLHIICGRGLTNPATRDGILELIEHVLDLSDPGILSKDCYYYNRRGGPRAKVIDYAIGAGSWAAFDFLCSRGAAAPNVTLASSALWDQATNPRGKIFRRLVSEFGANPAAPVGGDPIIMHCLKKYCHQRKDTGDGFEDNVVALIEAGADINAVNNEMETALNVAISMHMDLEFMRIMLQYGAEPSKSPCRSPGEMRRYNETMAMLSEFALPAALAERKGLRRG
ncbi:hypothetical protein PG993_012621 [Apiospora rasikravindrae]|uniref:Ankyrin n=1 Tax=Apiospora rasikravindrae TaxID=990691 RepID=A0ABR1S2X7_9PEZI